MAQADGEFRYPTAVTVDATGNIWVDDAGNARVVEIQDPTPFQGSFSLGNVKGASGIAVGGRIVYVVDASGEHILTYGPLGIPGAIITQGGHGAGQLSKPAGIAVDTQGNIYVADTNNNRIQKFSPTGASGGIYGQQGKAPVGTSPRFLGPQAVAVDTQGNIYVADTFNGRIQKLDRNGNFVWQKPVSGQPRGIAVDTQGNVYVTSFFNDKVLKLDANGKLITSWGGRGRGNGLFEGPAAIAVDSSGRVYVTDTGDNRVVIFSPAPDGSYIYSGQLGGAGTNEGQFSGLAGIAVTPNNVVYAVDQGGQRVERFNPFAAHFKSWAGGGHLQSLAGLALDTDGHIVITDSLSNTVDVYSTAGALIRTFQ